MCGSNSSDKIAAADCDDAFTVSAMMDGMRTAVVVGGGSDKCSSHHGIDLSDCVAERGAGAKGKGKRRWWHLHANIGKNDFFEK